MTAVARPRLTSAELVEDAQFLAASGESLRSVARRTGTTTVALERALYRAGEHGLVTLLRSRDAAPTAVGIERHAGWPHTVEGRMRLAEYRRHYEHAVQMFPDPPDVTAKRRLVLLGAA